MNKLVAIVLVYQDYHGGKRLADNLTKLGIASIWGDGRFKGVSGKEFPQINNSDLSTDGLKEYVLSLGNTTWLDIGLCLMEEKHNRLYDEAHNQGYTHALLMGCDEYIEGDVELFLKNLDSFDKSKPMVIRVPMIQHKTDVDIDQYAHFVERIFYMPHLIRTRKIHWTHFSILEDNIPDKPNVGMVSFPVPVFGITIHHDSSLREKKRDEMMIAWQKADVYAERKPIYDPIIEETRINARKRFQSFPRIQPKKIV